VRKKDGRPGNVPFDQRWIAEHQSELVVIEDGEYEGMLKFSGRKEDIGNQWQIPPNDRKCTATAYLRDENGNYVLDANEEKIRRPCLHWAIRGGNVCLAHGGGVDSVKRRARERLAAGSERAVGLLLSMAEDEEMPLKDRLKAVNSILDRSGIRAGVDVEVSAPEYEKVWDKLAKSRVAVQGLLKQVKGEDTPEGG